MTVFLWTEVEIVYSNGTDESELLNIPEQVLDEWLPMIAVLDCSTWGQVEALGPEIYQEVLSIAGYGEFADFIANFAITGQAPGLTPGPEAIAEWSAKQEEEVPTDDQAFEAHNDIPMVADGDWPPHINLLMAETFPEEILRENATWTYTSSNGDFAHIPLAQMADVMAKLERLGHSHRGDDRVHRLVYDI